MSKDNMPEKVQEAIFNDLLSRPDNQSCADCDSNSPTWVSIDFGVFLCLRCAGNPTSNCFISSLGVHRKLGPHITRVRSSKLDAWKKENIEIIAHTGNKISNDFYEYKMPSGYHRPTTQSTMDACSRFVNEKYIKKLFSPPKYPTPVEEFVANRSNGVIKAPTLVKE